MYKEIILLAVIFSIFILIVNYAPCDKTTEPFFLMPFKQRCMVNAQDELTCFDTYPSWWYDVGLHLPTQEYSISGSPIFIPTNTFITDPKVAAINNAKQ